MIENVRQILTQKDGYAKNTICAMLDEIGYNVCYKVIRAADYGVPQNRMRAVFVGIRKDIGSFDFDSLEKVMIDREITVGEAFEDLIPIEDKNNISELRGNKQLLRQLYDPLKV